MGVTLPWGETGSYPYKQLLIMNRTNEVRTSCTDNQCFSRVSGQELDVINMIFCIYTSNNTPHIVKIKGLPLITSQK